MINKHALLLCLCLFLCALASMAQRTVGLMRNAASAMNGYVLLPPVNDSITYLIDNCGRIVHKWVTAGKPGLSAYLLNDGALLRPYQINNPVFSQQSGGGIEKLDWHGNRIWHYRYTSPKYHQHHDICPMPNGNVLLLAFELKTASEALAAGREAAGVVWPEHIIEIEPIAADSGRIVWEWHSWDHSIQNYDSSKLNYGSVEQHPELLNLNYREPGINANDWLHGNGLDYHPEFDQIILSSRSFSEFFIIDHSTTTSEAASHSGGRYGKGGDILYRWGNPLTYGRDNGTNRNLYYQHNPNWIKPGLKGAGNILVFNNGTNRTDGTYSSVDELIPPVNSNGFYQTPDGNQAFAPTAPYWRYTGTPNAQFYSQFISGAQRLPNGNTFICIGMSGHLLEVDNHDSVVWEYINPSAAGGYIYQGEPALNNLVFRAYKYPENYPAFANKDLSAQGFIELNPGQVDCDVQSGLVSNSIGHTPIVTCTPNPVQNTTIIAMEHSAMIGMVIHNSLGELVYQAAGTGKQCHLDCSMWPKGVYTCLVHTAEGDARFKLVKW